MEQIIKLSSKLCGKLISKFVLLLIGVGKRLLWSSVRRSGECCEPRLTGLGAAAATAGFAGAALSVHTPDFLTGLIVYFLSVSLVYLLVAGKVLRYSKGLEGARAALSSAAGDLRKIGAERRVDYVCENSWMLIIRVGFVLPLCIGHYVWQCAEIQASRLEMCFLALFFVFQLLQLRYWSTLSRLNDMLTAFEIYALLNARNRLKKKWQSSVTSRVLSQLKTAQDAMSSLHNNQRELAVAYGFLVFSTLSSYTIVSLGIDVVSDHPLTSSSTFFQLMYIVVADADLRMMCDFNESIFRKIWNVEEILGKTTRDHIRTLPLCGGEYQQLTILLRTKYLRTCIAHSMIMCAVAHFVSFYLKGRAPTI